MKLKPLIAIVALLAVLSAVVFWRQRTPAVDATADARLGQPMLAPELLRQARSLAITGPDKQTVTVVANAKGEHWNVNEYHGLPADFDKLASTMESLRVAKIERSIGSATAQERLGFAGEQIELKDGAGKVLLTLHLGKNLDTGGRFIRYNDEKKSYVSDLSVWIDATPKSWAQAQLLKLKAEDFAALEYKFTDGTTLAAKRDANGNWTAEGLPEDKELKLSTIDATISELSGLRFSETTATDAPEANEAKSHLATTVTATLKNGTSYTVALGRKPAPPAPPAPVAPATINAPITATTPPVGIDGATGQVIKPDVASPAAGLGPLVANDPSAAPTAPPEPPQPGPVYAFVSSNRAEEPVNAMMQKRGFQVGDWAFTSLPANRDAVLQDKPKVAPAPAPGTPAAAAPATPAPAATPKP